PSRLATVQRGVRALQRPVEGVNRVEAIRYTNGYRAADRVRLAGTRHLDVLDHGTHALRHAHDTGLVRLQGDDHELLAAQTADQVTLASGGLEHIGNMAQNLITDLVAMGVIDVLKVIDIDDQQVSRTSHAQAKLRRQGVHQPTPVEQTSERVMRRQAAQLICEAT